MLALYVKATNAIHSLRRRFRAEQGLETTEYVLIAVAVIIVAFGAYTMLGNQIRDFINDTLLPLFGG